MGSNARRKRTRRRDFLIGITVIFVFLVAAAGVWEYLLNRDRVALYFKRPDGSSSSVFSLERADSQAEQEKGLMFRRSLDRDSGMIFVYGTESVHSFWMKNTYVPLDMVFVGSNKKVVGVLQNVPILSLEPRRVEAPSQYVIELPAGTTAAHSISAGAEAVFELR